MERIDLTPNYAKQAEDFLKKTRTTFKAEYVDHDLYFSDDKHARDIYRITLKRMGHSYTFRFGQSIDRSGTGVMPTAYDVLSCITKSDPGTFDDFCMDFGYDQDSRKDFTTYTAVCKEWKGIYRIFGDVLEALQEVA